MFIMRHSSVIQDYRYVIHESNESLFHEIVELSVCSCEIWDLMGLFVGSVVEK